MRYEYFDLIQPGDKILLAFSGGVDSVVLLDCLLEHQKTVDFELELFHLNHGIRRVSDEEELFVLEVARRHSLVLYLKRADVPQEAKRLKLGIEEAARNIRYRFMEALITEEGFDYVALAHHQDDNVETFFLNLFRGAGPQGLIGMAVRDGYKYRPLLPVSKAEILAYAQERRLEHVEDESNQDTTYRRNLLRQNVLPYLREAMDPNLNDHVLRTMKLLRQDEAYFHELQQAFDPAAESFSTEELRSLPPARFSRLIREILRQRGDLRDVGLAPVEALQQLIRESTSGEMQLGETIFSLEQTRVFIRRRGEILQEIETKELSEGINPIAGGVLELFYSETPEGDLAIPQSIIQGPLRIRSRNLGDRIALAPTVTKYLKNYFIDEKISRSVRDRIPLLTDDEQVFWVLGYRKAYLPKKPAPFICLRFTNSDK